MTMMKKLFIFVALLWGSAWAQSDCNPSRPEDTQVVDRGPVKTVIGPLAQFDPCHKSVKLDTPSFFAPKKGG